MTSFLVWIFMSAADIQSSKVETAVLQNQQELIRTLNEEKKANDQKFERLTKVIEGLRLSEEKPVEDFKGDAPAEPQLLPNLAVLHKIEGYNFKTDSEESAISEKLAHYCALVKTLLHQIDDVRYKIDHSVRKSLRTGIVRLHSKETCRLWEMYGYHVVSKAFEHEPGLPTYVVTSPPAYSPGSGPT